MTLFQRFAHGVHPPVHKERTRGESIRQFDFAPLLAVSLSQHAGSPAAALVQEGQRVERGECIAVPGGRVSVALHAPASGRVRGVGFAPSPRGAPQPAIFIEPTEASTQEIEPGQPCDADQASPAEVLSAIQQAGLVGLGGAAFPTHIKLSIPKGKSVDSVIVNGAECEPYLTTDYRVMLEQASDVMAGVRYLLALTGARRIVIGVESNSQPAAEALRNAATPGLPVTVETLPVKYPQGAEKMLIHALLGRDVPSGALPLDVGAICINVATTAEMGRLLPHGRGVCERVVTVAGPAIVDAGNYRIPIGTPLRFILEKVGVRSPASVVVGGPMMGAAVANLDVPLTKGMSGVLAFEEDSRPAVREQPCIRCGHCLDACPLSLNPCELQLWVKAGRVEQAADELHLLDCFECGSCSFVCPSHIELAARFRAAKRAVRRARAATALPVISAPPTATAQTEAGS